MKQYQSIKKVKSVKDKEKQCCEAKMLLLVVCHDRSIDCYFFNVLFWSGTGELSGPK